MSKWQKSQTYDCDIKLKNKQIKDYVIRYLKAAKKPVQEKELISKIYLNYNEILSYSIMIELKAEGLIIIQNGNWFLKNVAGTKVQ